MKDGFQVVGIQHIDRKPVHGFGGRKRQERPVVSILLLLLIAAGCLACDLFVDKDPSYLDLTHSNVAPNRDYLFGTDTMGRDIFSMIWYGGRISLCIGFVSTFIATVLAVIVGAVSGCASKRADGLIMRMVDILLSVPSLLVVMLLQAILGKASVLSMAIVIGLTGWMSMSKVIRTEVRQIKNSGYVIASQCMGGRFFHILWHHLVPNFISSIMFMVIMSVRTAIAAESTLSFMGIGLPIEVISWGSMLSLAEQALAGSAWWMILIPGFFLAVTLVCLTNLGNYLRRSINGKHSNL